MTRRNTDQAGYAEGNLELGDLAVGRSGMVGRPFQNSVSAWRRLRESTPACRASKSATSSARPGGGRFWILDLIGARGSGWRYRSIRFYVWKKGLLDGRSARPLQRCAVASMGQKCRHLSSGGCDANRQRSRLPLNSRRFDDAQPAAARAGSTRSALVWASFMDRG